MMIELISIRELKVDAGHLDDVQQKFGGISICTISCEDININASHLTIAVKIIIE
jgi:hypothetical protein